ncbi:hypothetical protein H7F15_15430 [Pontibacter sp. Tf4]|uniref:hypothetical protein n=1 Tax=Pontibacter sp. Tf4 TaxID=2761620 RepID=UPI0016276941|nr:hypothetical protein [Pontibacter sp. Tf4]MBB6612438.1 hypothetical protein [Pontibacter sp. Tf4]
MRTNCLFAIFIVSLLGCGPKNEEVTDEQITVEAPAAALDSVSTTRKDAVRVNQNELMPGLPLPATDLLSEKYPGWQQPELTPAAKQAANDSILVRGEFNGDTRQDIALQLQQNQDVVVVALLEGENGNWQLFELHRENLQQQNNSLQSPIALSLRGKGTELKTTADSQKMTSPYDAIALTQNGQTTVYLFRNGRFSNYSIAR